jgi:septal ring factor EnvC (AmiA/AmiB activator)
MPAFDDILALEEEAQALELEIGKGRDFVRQCSRRILDSKNALTSLNKNIETLERSIKTLKSPETPVVLLSEYDRVSHLLGENLSLKEGKVQEIQRLEKQGRETLAGLPPLEARLKQVEDEIENFSQVIPFRR